MAPQFAQQNKTNASSAIIIPNPSNGLFTYRTINFSPENKASIEVINSMGIKIISKMIDDENTNFDITQYGKGVYYLRAMNGKNVQVEKVVVK
ncbi:MAG: T9SS type A sorting domain-containing protein [Bacteroidetes bacterium]|nr:T9SS type A sorting domain-containing protein [Bacteroidota bacterium]